ncbi:triple gene block protein 3 [Clivia carlavirus A]|uniref:Movement protein TGBp3 n=1 Tax=Clivia carlavirus A TaxID=2838077 RepID=A0A8E7NG41_9VIRU|nr:triple gene block protein 3 [Clivia carlavirus A]QVY19181.1 triple gene block protein 3 [Clivia carlavirus A]
MSVLPNGSHTFLIIAASTLLFLLAFLALDTISNKSSSCVVIIDGQGVTISGCAFTPEFVEYAKGLQAFNFALGLDSS